MPISTYAFHSADCPYCDGHDAMKEIVLKADTIIALQGHDLNRVPWFKDIITLRCDRCKANAMWMEGMEKLVAIDPFFYTEEEQAKKEVELASSPSYGTLCVNCKWCVVKDHFDNPVGHFNECIHPTNCVAPSQSDIDKDMADSLVAGAIIKPREKLFRWTFCSHHRARSTDSSHCGKSGAWFEDKDAKVTKSPVKTETKSINFFRRAVDFFGRK